MNSTEKSPLAGGMLQVNLVTVIEPWFIRKETRSEERAVTGTITPIMANSFVEYYY
jgi:hypothetical protein